MLHLRITLLPLLLLATALARLARAAHLPAVRRPTPLQDSKRVLASRLIRSADRHKESSLRDVLGESDDPHGVEEELRVRRNQQHKSTRAKPVTRERGFVDRSARTKEKSFKRNGKEAHDDGRRGIRTLSELFQWAINNTAHSADYSRVFTAPERHEGMTADGREARIEVDVPEEGLIIDVGEEADVLTAERKALPPGKPRAIRDSAPNARRKKESAPGSAEGGNTIDLDFELLNSASESEFDIMRRNVHVLDVESASANKKVSALLMLEELCHSIDNGRDLQISGGISPLLRALKSRHDKVRASAAWALATCCQNNPPVQNASLSLDAVPVLSQLAAHDVNSNVRSKALFALNAMLELESARIAFEELPYAIDAVRNALMDVSNFRATRRALNLTELLVQKNLDAWKTQLEAWDIPVLIERLMRSHPDNDVRESAARTIAALDGKPVA